MENKWLKLIAIDLTIITVLFLVIGVAKFAKCSGASCPIMKKMQCAQKNKMQMGTPAHFEFLANDVVKAQKFYGDVFGWEFKKDAKLDYTMIKFAEKYPVCGGLMKKPANVPMPTTTMYFLVLNIEETVKKIELAGGKILMPKMEVKGAGWFAVCADSEGTSFGVWQKSGKEKNN